MLSILKCSRQKNSNRENTEKQISSIHISNMWDSLPFELMAEIVSYLTLKEWGKISQVNIRTNFFICSLPIKHSASQLNASMDPKIQFGEYLTKTAFKNKALKKINNKLSKNETKMNKISSRDPNCRKLPYALATIIAILIFTAGLGLTIEGKLKNNDALLKSGTALLVLGIVASFLICSTAGVVIKDKFIPWCTDRKLEHLRKENQKLNLERDNVLRFS